jgi:phage major head subunit gpT-like protein
MAVINTGLTTAGLKSDFFARLDSARVYWKDLATPLKSTTKLEQYGFLGTVPQVREWVGPRQSKGIHSESYSVENLKYEATIEVDRDELDDDQTGQIRLRVMELAERAATHKDFLIEELLKSGESAGFHGYDGVPFISDAHVSHNSGAQSNKLTFDATDPDDPTIEEFRGAFKQAVAQMVTYKDDQGEPLRIAADSGLVCIVPPSMWFTALDALSLALSPTAENPIVRNVVQGAARVITLPGLTDASKWYLCKTDVPIRPFIFQDRQPIEFAAVDNPSDARVFTTDRLLYGVRARYAMTYGYWYHCVRTDFVEGQ